MVVFVQATALRYDPDLDFECRLLLCKIASNMLTCPDLITASIYWSMLEVGLGYIATNLIVVYGLFARFPVRSPFRSLRSLLSLPKHSRLTSRDADIASHRDEWRTWPRETGQNSTSAKYVGRDIEEIPLASHEIHLKQEFARTVE